MTSHLVYAAVIGALFGASIGVAVGDRAGRERGAASVEAEHHARYPIPGGECVCVSEDPIKCFCRGPGGRWRPLDSEYMDDEPDAGPEKPPVETKSYGPLPGTSDRPGLFEPDPWAPWSARIWAP